MPAKRKNATQINLLPQEEFAESTSGRVLHWLLSTFRYLVITTEMIVISAFISRFYFDSRLADLNDEIKQKEDFVKAYSDFEKEFKRTQSKLAVFGSMTQDSTRVSPLLESVVTMLPNDLSLTQLSFTAPQAVAIGGTSTSEESISQFIVNLQSLPEFESVELSGVESKANSPFINFTLNARLKERG